MIMRILGEGQFDIAGEHLDELDLLDAQLPSAGEGGDRADFAAATQALRNAVRG